MLRPGATVDSLFDRAYHPGAAYSPRMGAARRWGMPVLLLVLLGVILGYWYLTDARRVRAMAQSYLGQLTGGRVKVRSATLSIFEGLRLDGVSVHVDESGSPDSQVFFAQTILIKYNPQSIFVGRLEATQIIALDPRVLLCEDLARGTWNWQRLSREERSTTRMTAPAALRFPEVLLRNAQVSYSRLREGRIQPQPGLVEIEGSIKPEREDLLGFLIQSRGGAGGIGPVIRGTFNPRTRAMAAAMEDFRYGTDVELMLPEQVKRWCAQHQLSGKLDIPTFHFQPGKNGQKSRFRVEALFKDVQLHVTAEEWLSHDEELRLAGLRRTFEFMKAAGLDGGGTVSRVQKLVDPSYIALDMASGRLVFTEDGIDVDHVRARVEHNELEIKGRIEGYSPQAPFSLELAGDNVLIPASPRWLNSIPAQAREVYDHLRPSGTGAVWVTVKRNETGAKPQAAGKVEIHNGAFVYDEFPYPLRNVTGAVTFGRDEKTGHDRVDLALRGMGAADGPNQKGYVDITGFIAPLEDAEIRIVVQASGVASEPPLMRAMPGPVREALRLFDAPGRGEYPKFRGNFRCSVDRNPGPRQKIGVAVELQLTDAQGQLVFFPYPIEHLSGNILITDDYTDIRRAVIEQAGGRLEISGIVRHEKDHPIDPHLRISGTSIPIDRSLLTAMPAEARDWIAKLGIAGKLDVYGLVKRDRGAPRRGGGSQQQDITYDLDLRLRDGAAWPDGGQFALTGLTGELKLDPRKLVMKNLAGKRGDATLAGAGTIELGAGAPRITMNVAARNLLLDRKLYDVLPAAWREGWDHANPQGTLDAQITYNGVVHDDAGAQHNPASRPAPQLAAATQPAKDLMAPPGFEAILRPLKLSVTPKIVPCRMDNVSGEIVIRPGELLLNNLTATRPSGGSMAVNGRVQPGKRSVWDLTLSAKDVLADAELKAALPPAAAKLLTNLKVEGRIGAQFERLTYQAPTTDKSDDAELALAGTLWLVNDRLDLGFPVSDVSGTLSFETQSRAGKLGALKGSLDLTSLKLAGRQIDDLKAELAKPAEADALRIGKLAGKVAGGNLAGQIDLVFPDTGPSRYGLAMVLRNADVKQLVGSAEQDIRGRLTASLALEGDWGDARSRRGRGDVSVTGKDMYKIPLMLGLLQITNLTLPISSPFNEAAARYSVEGERVTFEQIELRASNILMSGSGWLDFATRKVKLTFLTDNPNAWKIPFLHELLQGARQEFMQIQVSGTVQEPKVSGNMMSTFTTTVDEVLGGNRNEGGRKGKK